MTDEEDLDTGQIRRDFGHLTIVSSLLDRIDALQDRVRHNCAMCHEQGSKDGASEERARAVAGIRRLIAASASTWPQGATAVALAIADGIEKRELQI